jgi:vacuolar-type H+-ATPase subunit F/Vma7
MQSDAQRPEGSARLVVLGSTGLVSGFALIGAEVHAEADQAEVEAVLEQLAKRGDEALVLMETHLAHGRGYWLSRLRDEGGRIVIIELPPLTAPQDYAPAVDEVVRAVLGTEALKSR